MILRITKRLMIATMMVVTLVSSAVAEQMKTLNFGIISTESSQNLKAVWTPFLDDMGEALGVEVKPFFASDCNTIISNDETIIPTKLIYHFLKIILIMK